MSEHKVETLDACFAKLRNALEAEKTKTIEARNSCVELLECAKRVAEERDELKLENERLYEAEDDLEKEVRDLKKQLRAKKETILMLREQLQEKEWWVEGLEKKNAELGGRLN